MHRCLLLLAGLWPALAGAQALLPIPPALQASLAHQFVDPAAGPALAATIASARPRAVEVVTVQACYPQSDIGVVLARYAASGTLPGVVFGAPMWLLDGHDPNQCLVPTRIEGFEARGHRVLAFQVVLASPTTPTTRTVHYLMIQSTPDDWRFVRARDEGD